MTLQGTFEAIPFGVAAAVSITLAVFAWQRRSLPMAPAFFTLMAGEAAWALFEALELVVVEMPLKQVFIAAEDRRRGNDDIWAYWRSCSTIPVTAIGSRLAVSMRSVPQPWCSSCGVDQSMAPLLLGRTCQIPDWRPFAIARPIYAPDSGFTSAIATSWSRSRALLLAQAAVQSAGVYRAQAVVMLVRGVGAVGRQYGRHVAGLRLHPCGYRRNDFRGDRAWRSCPACFDSGSST